MNQILQPQCEVAVDLKNVKNNHVLVMRIITTHWTTVQNKEWIESLTNEWRHWTVEMAGRGDGGTYYSLLPSTESEANQTKQDLYQLMLAFGRI